MYGRVAALLIFLTAATAAAGPPPDVSAVERTQGDLRLRVAVRKTVYQVGEPIEIRLTVTNAASAPVSLTQYSGQQSDVLVRQRGALIWQWSHDKAFVQVVKELTMAPGERVSVAWVWDQRDLQGRQVEAGAYEITAVFLGAQRSHPRSAEVGPLAISIGR